MMSPPAPAAGHITVTPYVLALGICVAGCGSIQDPADDLTFLSTPLRQADHNRPYLYAIEVADAQGGAVTVTVPVRPDWMSFDDATVSLSGTAGWDNVGSYPVTISASNGLTEATQSFAVAVIKGEIICNQDFGDPAESTFILPFKVEETYSVIQSYCPSNPAWGHHNWFAYDFDMALGDTVLATRAGEVLFVQESFVDGNRTPGQENFVFVRHADRTVMHYMHLTLGGALVEVGDLVDQGQPIALTGDTGNSSGPHLHIALFHDATDFNRQATLPINFRNADGPTDSNRGLVQQRSYTAQAFVADSR